MLEIKILCAPEDLAAHLDALCGIDPAAYAAAPKVAEPKVDRLTEISLTGAEDRIQKKEDADFIRSILPHSPETAERIIDAAESDPPKKRHRRTKEQIAADEAAARAGVKPESTVNKSTISSGEERVNPQDTADEEAQRKAENPDDKITHYHVRAAIKKYGDTFGHEAAARDMRDLVGLVSEIPDDQEKLKAAIDKINAQIASGARPAQAEVPKAAEPAPQTEPETGSLFGDDPAPEPPKPEPFRATEDDLKAVAAEYAKKFDPAASPPLSSPIVTQDLGAIIEKTFGATVKSVKAVREMGENHDLRLGMLVLAMRQALIDNPFKR